MTPRARGTENGPAIAQIADVFTTKSAEIERCKRDLPGEDRHLIKSQSGISSSNEIVDSYISPVNTMVYKIVMVGPAPQLAAPRVTRIRTKTSLACDLGR